VRSRPLTADEFDRLVVPAFRRVFQATDAFAAPLRDGLSERLILFPVRPRLGEGKIDAVADAARAVGDGGFYVVETEPHWRELLGESAEQLPVELPKDLVEGLPPDLVRATWAAFNRPMDYSDHQAWWFSVDDLAPAKEASTFGPNGETAFISPSAQWGILVSHEDHAIVGGPPAFVETLTERFPPFTERDGSQSVSARDQVSVFLQEVRDGWQDPMKWLPQHLTHIYGNERAGALLREFGFTK
jgi:hypothetical protein